MAEARGHDYESFYHDFDSPLMRQMRREAYGEDIGQHSWATAAEIRDDIGRLRLTARSHLIDLGCGPCGPLTLILATIKCRGTGVELSPAALRVGRGLAAGLGVESLLALHQADLNQPLPFEPRSFDAATSVDVVLHVHDRLQLFRDVAKLLTPGGRFLFTDAGVITGAVSNDELQRRSGFGYTQFVAPGWNERLLEAAGFTLIATENRTGNMERNATGRLTALRAHRAELESLSGLEEIARQEEYLGTVVELARRGALARMMYLAEMPGGQSG